MRKTSTGGTRSNDEGKIDYRHLSAVYERMWCEYMHEHRIQEDGNLRDADNYKKGLEFEWYLKSLLGHIQDLKLLMEGVGVAENGKPKDFFEAVMAIAFNLQGLVIETMRGETIDRKFTNGDLKQLFIKNFYTKLNEEKTK